MQADICQDLQDELGEESFRLQVTRDEIPTYWVSADRIRRALEFLKLEAERPYRMLYDLSAIDERHRIHHDGQPDSDFTIVYHLLSFERNRDVRLKVPLRGETPALSTISDLWSNANWYEREVWDMFGISFDGHPHLSRILMPRTWEGHPLRKEHPARATEMGPFELPVDRQIEEEEALQFHPEEWGLERAGEDTDFMFLNLGPHHPGTHGLLRIVLQLDGEDIVDAVPEIGFHHRGAEKMGERQTWHTYIPYTDRIDYLGGVMNNLAYVLGVEKLAGIEVPPRVEVVRVMLAEFFRIASHLLYLGTFAQDLGAMSPVFYMLNDRERIFDIVEGITGGRMHPSWFRIGGVAQDLPHGWERMVGDFVAYFPARIDEYSALMTRNRIFRARTSGVGEYTVDEAIEWGVTGPGLRACGFAWDLRKTRPYSGYHQFDFDVPTTGRGDSFNRAVVHLEELRQSLRIIEQCLGNMPAGPYKADHPLTTPPPRERMQHDIETLIAHFLGTTWGPVIPPGEAMVSIEATKGNNGYYLISDGNTQPYRVRIRTPSFPHMQMIPFISRGAMLSDLIAVLGSIDFVLADVDR